MLIRCSDKVTEILLGKLTPKHIQKLSLAETAEPVVKRLFNGHFNTIEVKVEPEDKVSLRFSKNGSPGYMRKVYRGSVVRIITQNWINSPILNRSGLASLIWNDDTPNKLRRRLENRARAMTFREEEKEKIISELEDFVEQVKRSLNN